MNRNNVEMEKKKLKRNWLIYAASGLALVGFGLSLMGEALIQKYEQTGFNRWFFLGTLALVVVNTGLALFGKAVTIRVKLDRLNNQ